MRRRRALVAAAAVLLVLVVAAVTAAPALAAASDADAPVAVDYRPPADAELIDRFRPPPTKYGAGNRGVDYDTAPGTPVQAAADGEVVFSGRVGLSSHVVVLHADGVRTTYAFLAATTVRRGDRVVAGQTVGVTEGALHFGARIGDEYVDPLLLLGGDRPHVRLVPDDVRRPASESQERRWLTGALRHARRFAGAGVAAVRATGQQIGTQLRQQVDEQVDRLLLLQHYAQSATGLPTELLVAADRWRQQQGHCTPPGRAVATKPPPERRIVVLVGGLGSSSDNAAVFDLDTAGLGYATGDVHRFSYTGAGTRYGPADTVQDLRTSARRLREQIDDIRRRDPGVPIDVIAHSQGGLVARRALADGTQGIATLITVGTPHHGANLATAKALLAAASDTGDDIVTGVGRLAAGVDLDGPSISQLSETSDFIRDLDDTPLPSTTRLLSIGGRQDWVVPSARTGVPGGAATNVVVNPSALRNEHDALPRSPEAATEMRLALNGLPPTCHDLRDHLTDAVTSTVIEKGEDAAALGLAYGGARLDQLTPEPVKEVVHAAAAGLG